MTADLAQFRRGVRLRALAAGLIWTLGAGLGPFACSSLRVSVQHDESVDFQTYRTYVWSDLPGPPTGSPIVDDNALMDRRVQAVVDRELAARGFELREEGPADLTIHYHAILQDKSAVITTRDYEAYGTTEVLRAQHTEVRPYTQGTLLLDMHDSGRQELVWRGVARNGVDDLIGDPDLARAALERAVAKMLVDFPPSG